MSDTKKRFISRTCKVQIPPDLVVNHKQLVLLTLLYTLSSVQTVFTWHVASGNQGVSCSRQLKSSGLPLNQMECGTDVPARRARSAISSGVSRPSCPMDAA